MLKKRIALFIALGMLLPSAACAAKSSVQNDMMVEAPAMEAAPMASAAFDTAEYAVMEESMSAASASGKTQSAKQSARPEDAATRKIVYNADMSMTADDPLAAQETIIGRAAQLGGYVADSYTTNDDLGARRSSVTIKIPADKLEELVTAAKSLGRVDDYQLSSDDITMNYYDVAARLSSAQAEEKQLLEILEKCETVEDILAVRESLASVRGDIESYQGQINLWDNLVSYATLYLTINRTPQPAVKGETELLTVWKASDVWNRMSRGFVNSARFVVNAVGAVGIFLAVAIIPAAVLFVAVVLPILLAKKRRRAKAEANGEPLPPTRKEKRAAKRLARHSGKRAGAENDAPPERKPEEPGAPEA